MHTIILITGVHTHGDDVHFSDKTVMYCRECKQEVETYTLADDEAIEQIDLSCAINAHTEAQDALATEEPAPADPADPVADMVDVGYHAEEENVYITFNKSKMLRLPVEMVEILEEDELDAFLEALAGLYHSGVVAGREDRA